MSEQQIVLMGVVLADGSLEVAGKVGLPAGPVEVEIRSVRLANPGDDLLTIMARIRDDQLATGHVPRTVEEIDAEIREGRDE